MNTNDVVREECFDFPGGSWGVRERIPFKVLQKPERF